MARQPTVTLQTLAVRLQVNGPMSAQSLAAAAGVDRARISRLIARAGDDIVQIGAARRSRFALRRPVKSAGTRWPLYQITESGQAHEVGELESFYHGWRLRWTAPEPQWADIVTDPDHWTEGFPFFLADLRPQGFVGRGTAREVAARLPVPNDPTQWGDDDTLVYLQAEGVDLPGNLVVGDTAVRRALASGAAEPVDRAMYPELAGVALAGGVPGSGAGGEYPKFLTRVRDSGGNRPVLVKFSQPLDTAIGRRWADLLAAEAIAANVLTEHGESQAGVRTIDIGGRRFLEVPRFDRIGERGRRGVISLQALLGTEGAVETTDWVVAAEHFERIGLVGAETAAAVRRRRAFGELIGNSDMHPGNLSFFLDDARALQLTPSYDMLPMLWAPVAGGEILPRDFQPLPPVPRQVNDWAVAAAWAETFWQRVAADPAISNEFGEIARQCADRVGILRQRYGTMP